MRDPGDADKVGGVKRDLRWWRRKDSGGEKRVDGVEGVGGRGRRWGPGMRNPMDNRCPPEN